MTLFDHIKSLFEHSEKFFSDGSILKNKLVESALNLDPELLKILLADERAKKTFFQEVEDLLVFDKIKFQKFVSNKEFLPDSFTAFKNKIGLTANGEYLTEAKEVVLDFPYKDCVLEGGQTKEDQKRQEIFWNETLAPDEIDRLFEPKVFTNWKRFDKDGEHEVSSISKTDNFIIKGNNLLALHSLEKTHKGQVKMIYIDPPYNTGSDGFNYNDSFNHSTWLTFMKNRLEISKKLLSKDGVIFVHIGDEEMHYLKVLMDDVFGKDFFVGTIPRKTRSGKSDVPFKFSQDFDWILVYTLEPNYNSNLFKREIERKYYSSEDFPNDAWRLNPITTQRTIYERPNSNFTMINPKNGDKFEVNPQRSWAVTKDTFSKYYAEKKIVFPGDYDFLKISSPMLRVFKSDEISKKGDDFNKTFFSSDQININIENLLKNTQNKNGTAEIISMFGEKAFAYPKNELLLKTLIESCTNQNDIVLDYHLGSGTTAAVAHKLNRRYIGIEQMDYIEEVTVNRLKKVISNDQNGISKDVGWNGGGSFVYMELLRNSYAIEDLISEMDEENFWQNFENTDFSKSSNIRFDLVEIEKLKSSEEFRRLSLQEKKAVLITYIDKNMFYVPYSEINDLQRHISVDDKTNNNIFYNI